MEIDKRAQLTQELFLDYRSQASTWRDESIECVQYRLGNQIPSDVSAMLKKRGQAPLAINRVHSNIEQLKAMLTYNYPRFHATAREDSDVKVAAVIGDLFQYIWYISEGNVQLKQTVDDYCVKGKGYLLVYFDPMDDWGKGEVKVTWVDSEAVYTDPNCKNRFERDADNIIISNITTKTQAKIDYPDYKGVIDQAATSPDSDYNDGSSSKETQDMTHLPSDVTDTKGETVRIYDRYTKIAVKYYRIFDRRRNVEELMLEDDYIEFTQQLTYVLVMPDKSYQYFDSQEEVMQGVQQLIPHLDDNQLQAYQSGEMISTILNADLIEEGIIEVADILQPRIHLTKSVDKQFMYEATLPCSTYPIVPFPNIWTGTPYPMSDVAMVRDLQDFLNKMYSLIIAHATNTTNLKLLLPRGSVGKEDIEEQWGKVGAVIEYDATQGKPELAQPSPFPSELYACTDRAVNEISNAFGIYEMSGGNPQGAPQTVRGTLLIDEFGQRRVKSKVDDIEGGLNIVGKVVLEYIQNYYTLEKTVRLVKANNETKFTINQHLYDDFGNALKNGLDVTAGRYDVQVISSSSLPTNRMAKLEQYRELYKEGIIGPRMVLTSTDVVDAEKALEEIDMITNLQQTNGQLQEDVKKLKGDLQTREREVYHSKQAEELAKFKAGLDKIESSFDAKLEVYNKRTNDIISELKKLANRDNSKETPKKGKKK